MISLVIFNSCMPNILPNFRLDFCDLCSTKPQKIVSFRGFSLNPTWGDQNPPPELVPSLARAACQNPNSALADGLRPFYSNSTPLIIFYGTALYLMKKVIFLKKRQVMTIKAFAPPLFNHFRLSQNRKIVW